MKRVFVGLTAALLMCAPRPAAADVIELVELAINVDGTVEDSLGPPVSPLSFAGFDDAAFDYATGLGKIVIKISGAGAHSVAAFYDIDLFDDGPNSVNTFFDDSGEVLGVPSPAAGWEIDEPGFGVSYTGDIFANFSAGVLDQMIFDGVITQDDVSIAMSLAFVLAANQTAIVTFLTSTADPGGFSLHQFDESGDVFLSASLDIIEKPVAEPALLLLLGAGAAGRALVRRKRA